MTFFGAATVDGDPEAWQLRMRTQLRANQAIALAVLVIGIVLGLTVARTGWAFLFCGALIGDIAVVEWCIRRLEPATFVSSGVIAAVALWLLALVLVPLVSFALPILAVAILITVLAVAPLLDRAQVVRFIVAGAVTVAAVAVLAFAVEAPIDPLLPDTVRHAIVVGGLTAFTVPMGFLAWDSHVRHRVAIDRLVATNEALRASRARLVQVADAERRTLERNLHDGAQQRLVGLAVRLRLVGVRRPELTADVNELITELQGAIDELRELAHGIYPPLLERRGLVEALTAAARRSPVPATVTAHGPEGDGPVGRYPPEVETAAYFCCLEALQNAAKYAGPGATVTIRVAATAATLSLTVADDGVGFDPDGTPPGRGLTNMTDRVLAVDGTFEVRTAPGRGVQIAVGIPVAVGVQAPPPPVAEVPRP